MDLPEGPQIPRRECGLLKRAAHGGRLKARARLGAIRRRNRTRPAPTGLLDSYFQQCSALDARYVRDLLSVMYTCGMYDFSGDMVLPRGLPANGGVGGSVRLGPASRGIATRQTWRFAPRVGLLASGGPACVRFVGSGLEPVV